MTKKKRITISLNDKAYSYLCKYMEWCLFFKDGKRIDPTFSQAIENLLMTHPDIP